MHQIWCRNSKYLDQSLFRSQNIYIKAKNSLIHIAKNQNFGIRKLAQNVVKLFGNFDQKKYHQGHPKIAIMATNCDESSHLVPLFKIRRLLLLIVFVCFRGSKAYQTAYNTAEYKG